MARCMAVRRPVLFSSLVTLAFVVLLVAVTVAQRAVGGAHVQEAIGAGGRAVVGVGVLLALAWLGWRRWLAGPGSGLSWLLVLPPLVYVLTVYPPLFTGTYAVPTADPSLVALVALNGLAAGVMEELVFRGLVLGSLLAAWGRGRGGLGRALVVSSLFFSVPHALNVLAGADPVRTTAQLVWAFLLGVVFAALTVAGGTVWPVALLHGLGNALIHANRLGHDGAMEPAAAVLLALAPLPLVVYSWLVLRRVRRLGWPEPKSSTTCGALDP